MLIVFVLMFILAMFVLAVPVVYMGQIDMTTAMLLVVGTAYAIWFVYRLLENKKQRNKK
jgi:predicted RND superfamily exporter protein